MKRKSERLITYQKIEAFGQWLESCERSMETVKKYRHYLKQFKEFIGDEPVTKEMVLLWKANLREHITPVTINCVIAALNGFFKYCGWDGCESKFLKISKSSFYPERKELTKNEYERLVKAAFANGNERLALVLETICASGIRAARKLLSEIEIIYSYLESDPHIYPQCDDPFLRTKGYHKATVNHFQYVILFLIDDKSRTVYISGLFHEKENYGQKL